MDDRELKEIAKNTEEMLLNIGKPEEYEDIGDFLSEGVLSVKRVQSKLGSKWETTEYILCVGFGGPNIDISTAGYIHVAWWSESYYYDIGYDARDILDECKEYLDEIYGCDLK